MNYRIYTIAEYLEPTQAMRLNRTFVKRFFPRSVEVVGLSQLQKFYGVVETLTLDTSRLEEVRIVLDDETGTEPIGWVPASVRKLSLYVNGIVDIDIPNTVVDVTMEMYSYYQALDLPDSVKKLTLMRDFDAIVRHWPNSLEELRIDGWCTGNGRWAVPIDFLPDNIKRLTLNNDLDIEILQWPDGIEEVVLEGYAPSLEMLWWSHAKLSDDVRFVMRPTHN
jgi:hypothetical protein